nr:hypothetical protein [Raineyella fluvialis]
MVRGTVPGAIIIHLFGGIHEIFFPYVLMKPKLIAATILGGMSGVFTGTVLGAGLVAPASPGSILAWMAVTPRGNYLANLADFGVATVVSFVVAFLLLKAEGKEPDVLTEEELTGEPLEGEAAAAAAAAAVAANPTISGKDVRQVVIACDAGMGSSVMVASAMKKKLKPYGVDVIHTPVNEIPRTPN